MSEETTKRVNYHKNGNLPLFYIEKDTRGGVLYAPFACVLMAQRKGFEPLYELPHNMISNHARSTAPPSLQQPFNYILFPLKKQVFLLVFSIVFALFSASCAKKQENDVFPQLRAIGEKKQVDLI